MIDLGNKCMEEMYYGQRKRADTSNDRSGKQMNRNAIWLAIADKGGHQQRQMWETNE